MPHLGGDFTWRDCGEIPCNILCAEAHFRRGRSTGGLVELDLARGQPGKALKLLQDQPLTRRDLPAKQVQYHTQRGLALAAEGRLGEAALDLRQAVEGVEDLRRRAPGERTGFFQAGPAGYDAAFALRRE